jgi:branched-chain amino acid transport system substrate-binding protein
MQISIQGFLLLACALLSSPNFAQGKVAANEAIVINHIGPLTNSVLAASNKEALDAADLYLKKINDAGGVNGRKVIIVRHDDNQDPKKTAEIAKSLIERRDGIAFIMPRSSPSTEALMPLVEEANIPLIGPQPGPSSATTPMKRHVFAIRASYSSEVARAIELQYSFGRRSFAFLVASDAFGDDVLKGLDPTMSALKLKAAGIERIDNRNPDVTKAVDNFAKLKPEVVMFVCAAKCGADFVKAYAKTGNVTQFVALSNASNSGFVKELGDMKSGVIVMQVLPSPNSPKVRVSREYRDAARDAKQPVTYQSMQGFVTAKLLVEGLKRTGKNPTSASLTASLEGMRNFDLGGLIVDFGTKERMGSKFVEATMISKDGRFIY